MEYVSVKETNKEIWVDLGKNYPTKLSALEEAGKVILRETLREKQRVRREEYQEGHNDGF